MTMQAEVPGAPRRALLFCVLVALCEGIDLQSAGVAAGGIARELHPDAAAKGLYLSASTLGLFLGAVLGGLIADRRGRRPVLIASIALFGVFSLGTAAAGRMETLTLMRFLTGLGLGGAMPNLIAVVAEAAPAVRRYTHLATMYMAMPLGGALASLVILVAPPAAWRAVFLAGGVLPLVVVPLARWLPAAARRSEAAAPAGAMAELFAAGRWRRTLLLWVSFFLALLVLFLLLSWLPTLNEARGLSKDAAAAAQACFNVGGALCALLMGRLLDGRFREGAIIGTFALLAAALFGLADDGARGLAVPALAFLVGGGVLAAQTVLYGVAADTYAAAHRGAGVGAGVAAGRLGSIAGPLIGALLVGAGRSPSQVLTGILPIVVACALGTTLLGWRRAGRG